MRIAVFIDYANLFISVKNNMNLKVIEEVEEEICRIINSTEGYLSHQNDNYNKEICITRKVAYVLEDKSFGTPEKRLSLSNIEIRRVKDEHKKKNLEMKAMNRSRKDDETLMRECLEYIKTNNLDGALIITNDGDFVSLGEKLQHIGRYFWIGTYEGKKSRASSKLKKVADMVLPLHEISLEIEESEPLPPIVEEDNKENKADENYEESVQGPCILIYRHGEIIINYPLNKPEIGIGRRSTSRFYFPHIDLTDYDLNKVVSRQHAVIRKINNRVIFLVHNNCTSGTWVGETPVYANAQFILKPNMLIVFGDIDDGFGLEYKQSSWLQREG